jgi:hypothetical protein
VWVASPGTGCSDSEVDAGKSAVAISYNGDAISKNDANKVTTAIDSKGLGASLRNYRFITCQAPFVVICSSFRFDSLISLGLLDSLHVSDRKPKGQKLYDDADAGKYAMNQLHFTNYCSFNIFMLWFCLCHKMMRSLEVGSSSPVMPVTDRDVSVMLHLGYMSC